MEVKVHSVINNVLHSFVLKSSEPILCNQKMKRQTALEKERAEKFSLQQL